jgi:hypothetical protein
MQHGQWHGSGAWIWTCSMNMTWHSILTWTCSMNLETLHVHVHAAWTSTSKCCMSTSLSMLHAQVLLRDQVHAACTSPCCIYISRQHVHLHAACLSACCVSMSMPHVHVYVYAVCISVHANAHVFMPETMSLSTFSMDKDMQRGMI